MVIETMMIPLATAILKALKIVASLEKASREVKSKCRDLDERVQTLQGILRGYLSAAAENEGTAAARRGLEAALGAAARDVESCGGVGLVLSVVSDTNSKDLAKLKAAEEKIERCISDLRLAQAVIIQPQPVIVCHIHVGKLYLELPRGAAALEQPHMQMLLEELAPGVVPDVPSSPCRLIAPTPAVATTTTSLCRTETTNISLRRSAAWISSADSGPVAVKISTAHLLGDSGKMTTKISTAHLLADSRPAATKISTAHLLGDSRPATTKISTAHLLGDSGKVTTKISTAHLLGDSRPVTTKISTAHLLGDSGKVTTKISTAHLLGDSGKVTTKISTAHLLGDSGKVTTKISTAHLLGDSGKVTTKISTAHLLGYSGKVTTKISTAHLLLDSRPTTAKISSALLAIRER